MAKIKFNSKREDLSIAEVLEQYECTVDDLFHAAANGEITIYALANDWKVAFAYLRNPEPGIEELNKVQNDIVELLNSDEPDAFQRMEKYQEEVIEKYVGSIDRKHEEAKKTLTNMDDIPEYLDLGNRTILGNKGLNKGYYQLPLVGLMPIDVNVFTDYREGYEPTYVELDFNEWQRFKGKQLGVVAQVNSEFEPILHPKPSVLLKDALDEGKLYLMKADLPEMASGEQIANKKSAPNKGPRKATLERYAVWQKMADEIVAKKPNSTIFAVGEIIYSRLDKTEDKNLKKHLRDVNTIRQNIKVN